MSEKITIKLTDNSEKITVKLKENARGPAGSDANVTNTNVNAAISDDPAATRLALEIPINNFTATSAPSLTDDETEGYTGGSKWYDSVGGEAYLCVDPAEGAAVWIKTTLTADELGSAAFTSSTDYATAAQGALADSAIQAGDLGSAAYAATTDFAAATHTHTVGDIVSVSSQRLLGRHAGGSGAGQEVTVGNGLEFSGSGIRREALTGDVTATAGSNTTTIANGAVTEAKCNSTINTALTNERVPTEAGLTTKFSTEKTTPVNADGIAIFDSAASNAPKKVTWTNAWLNYFKGLADALYVGLTGNQTVAGNKTFSGELSATGVTLDDGSKVVTRETLDTRYLINMVTGRYDFPLMIEAFQRNFVSSGSVEYSVNRLRILTSATAGSSANLRSNGSGNGAWWLPTGSRQVMSWSRRTSFNVRINSQDGSGSDTVFRAGIGQTFDVTAPADLVSSNKGLQFKMINYVVYLLVANGTTLTTSDALTTVTVNVDTDLLVVADGTGNWQAYVNGTLVQSGTGAPTGNSTFLHNNCILSLTNGTTAAIKDVFVQKLTAAQLY
jgi:hypothetical protein